MDNSRITDSNTSSVIEIKDELQNEPPVKIKKKRGRKKKIKTPEEIEREKNKPKQRRGRKPKSLMNHITTKSEIDAMMKKENKEDTVILNLKINKPLFNDNDNNLNQSLLHSKGLNEPVAFDCNNNNFSKVIINNNINNINNNDNLNNLNCINNNIDNLNSISDNINNNISNIDNNNIKSSCGISNKKSNIYNNLQDFIKNDNWVKQTNNYCFWCCHGFNNTPFGLPIKYKEDKFSVSGCFCSLECAAAYNFAEEKNIQDIWECYNLINLLSHKIEYNKIVKLAPKRNCLKIFGGNMSIDEFRTFTESNKIINVLEYPMIAVTQQIEEINYNNDYNKNNYIPIDETRIQKLEQKIKLMRSKPLLNNKNTLEHTMNIKINE